MNDMSDLGGDTIAVVTVDGNQYEIDWPWCVEDECGERDRDPDLAAIYDADGELVDYIDAPPGGFACEVDVITAAMTMLAPDREEGPA